MVSHLRSKNFEISSTPIIGLTPFEQPDLVLAQAMWRQNVAATIDFGRQTDTYEHSLQAIEKQGLNGIGVRIPENIQIDGALKLPANVAFVVLGEGATVPNSWGQVTCLYQVSSVESAKNALVAGARGLVVKGQECGGTTGSESSFVLLQRVLKITAQSGTPVWCQGGMSLHTCAAVFAAGAQGVVLDSAMALLPECQLPAEMKKRIAQMDGGEKAGSMDPAIGQDAALAKGVQAECGSVEEFIRNIRVRVQGQLHQAQVLHVMAPGNAWAQSHGVKYPIAQGPMTRVSDTAEFAESVANAGALPFVALSLMNAEASEKLLRETAEKLQGKSWGVGVLAFADPAILEPQLELVKRYKPDVLLLAGGRPSQTRPFTEQGIACYLHVPSPGLLDLFLKEGGTHFVFEGRECGGHVGPRYSFVLWEQAISRLLQAPNVADMHVLFAGGIHDEISSAMVAAIAAPLVARGAKVGVLMGTAYIATQEAVTTGAIIEEFQAQALKSETTALVETAPGHAIRCVPSGFMTLFERERQRLQEAGVDQKDAWKQLEELTVGRLRIASKGVDRVQGQLVTVDRQTQLDEGMYMIGQVIVMHKEVLTMAELHNKVSEGALKLLNNLRTPEFTKDRQHEPIAIVGMACLYAGSPDLESFWQNVLAGKDLVTEVPQDRWSVSQYYRGANAPGDKSVSKWGGFISPAPFDPLKYGIPPASLAAIEPVQLLSLEVSQQALIDAGYDTRWFDREKTSVIFGAEAGMDLCNQYTLRNLWQQYAGDIPPELAEALPTLTEDSFPGMLVNVISGRIANRLGLGGVNYAVTSACASSLTALELGVKELRSGTSEMVLAGGADFHNGINDYLLFSSVGALSPTGRCRSFDNSADGIALGEGIGVVVLKRLSDAQRDGDRIYAIVDGVAGSSDGKGLGLTAPRKEGQKRALERAYHQAGVMPSEIGLVEAHGTGTVVGDRTELQTLTEVYSAGGALSSQAVLGSVKSQIGHTKCAAGVAGLIKLAKALHHRVRPGTQWIEQPNTGYQRESSPFQLNREANPWLTNSAQPRRAAVSAFGFGGANFHAVLSAWPAHQSPFGAKALPVELVALRGGDAAQARQTAAQLSEWLLESTVPLSLADVASTVWQAGDGPIQWACTASTVGELQMQLAQFADKKPGKGHTREDAPQGKLAFLFSGQGSQYVGMLRELFVFFPDLQHVLGQNQALANLIYPPTAYRDDEKCRQQHRLTDTRAAQPALGMVEWALAQWLGQFGIKPDMAAGHSYGELAALAHAGAMSLEQLLNLSTQRAQAMLSVMGEDTGKMAAVSLDTESLKPLLAAYPDVVMANQNSPVQTVISGPSAAMDEVAEHLKSRGIACKAIQTACAFHSPMMKGASARFKQCLIDTLGETATAKLGWPVYSNLTTEPYAIDQRQLADTLATHLSSPVRFVDQIQAMYDAGARVFVEIGPKRVLTGLVDRILGERDHTALATDDGQSTLKSLFNTLALLAVKSEHCDLTPLYEGRGKLLDVSKPARLTPSTWMVDGARAVPLQGKLPAHAGKVVTKPVVQPGVSTTGGQAAFAPAEQAVAQYLNNMRDMISAQRDVLVSYFGQGQALSVSAPSRTRLTAPTEVQTVPVVEATAHSTPTSGNLKQTLLTLVSEKTGYPVESLDTTLDLEADLSIDSIKRLEIVGELLDVLGVRGTGTHSADHVTDALARSKTLDDMLTMLNEVGNKAEGNKAPAAMSQVTQHTSLNPVDALLGIVSDCTGYPPEALDLDLDLEADLSIDSIKRLEIVGRLADLMRLPAGRERDEHIDRWATSKNLRSLSEALNAAQQATAQVAVAAEPAGAEPDVPTIPFERFVLRNQTLPEAKKVRSLKDKHLVVVTDQLGLADKLAARLGTMSCKVTSLALSQLQDNHPALALCDGLVHLAGLGHETAPAHVKTLFPAARQVLMNGGAQLLLVTGLGGDFGVHPTSSHLGAGLAGLAKSFAREFPEADVKVLDLNLEEAPDELADHLVQELLAADRQMEVARRGNARYKRIAQAEILHGQADFSQLGLDNNSVVLLTGGAKGITSLVACELAERYRCKLELVGRSAAPSSDEGPETRNITDTNQLRRILLEQEAGRKPAEVERLLKTLLAEREFRQTVRRIEQAGGQFNYHAVDVRDTVQFGACIESIYARHGRIDGVIHGAGVIEDKLARDKTLESFARVFDTKVNGALTLRSHIRADVRFVVFFSSISSAFGNRGQTDYASANDVLDKMARSWQSESGSARILSVNWGPWADTGMVNDALKKEYARKGIGLVPQDQGVQALLSELCRPSGDTQVVLMSAKPDCFDETEAGAKA